MTPRSLLAIAVVIAAAAAVAAAGWLLLRAPADPPSSNAGIGPARGTETPDPPARGTGGDGAATGAPGGAPAVEDGDPDDESDLDRDLSGETGGATAEEILAALARGDAQGWLEAARLLSIAGSDDPRVTDALLKAMSDDRWRLKAADMAKHLKDPGALARFLDLARADGNENTRSAALLACAAIGGPGVMETAVDLLRNSKPGGILAGTAALALGRLGTPDAARVLVESLRESLGTPRQGTFLEALGKVSDPEAIAILTGMVSDEATDPRMRQALVAALGRTKDPSGVDALLLVARGDGGDAIRFEAYRALASVGSPEAVTALLNVLHGEDNLHKAEAAAALQQVRGKGAAPLLEKALSGPVAPELRSYLITALGEIRSKTSVEPLAAIAREPSEPPGDRTASVRALGEIGDSTGADVALGILEKEPKAEPALRMTALGTLSMTATEADIPRVEALLRAATPGTPEYIHLDAILKSLKKGGVRSILK